MAEVFVPPPSGVGITTSNKRDALECAPFAFPEREKDSSSVATAFVFPAPGTFTTPSNPDPRRLSNTGTSSLRASGHRRKPSNLSLNTLPPFEFGIPNQESPPKSSSNPSRSPIRLTPPVSHSNGHKRGGSEFVGGEITHGGPVLVSTISADEGPILSPPSPAKGPRPGRRGHAHRRSHAVSQSDVKSIMQPSKEDQGGSVPSTPSDSAFQQRPPGPQRSNSHPGETTAPATGVPPLPTIASHGQAQIRARVGFSDSLEFIPRPLSTVSSETCSSMSTIRANHSVSDSVSSFVTGDAPSPPSLRASGNVEASITPESLRARPTRMGNSSKTFVQDSSDLVIEEDSQINLPSLNAQPPLAMETGTLDSQTYGQQRRDLANHQPESSAHHVHTSNFLGNLTEVLEPRQRPISLCTPQMRPKTSPELNPASGHQKFRSWADGKFHRKEKPISHIPTSLSTSAPSASDESAPNLDFSIFDNDTTMIIEDPIPSGPIHPQARTEFNLQPYLSPDVVQPSPMIDLDIALHTASNRGSIMEDDYLGKHATAGKRRLHSSGETGGFMGPGMHYHRRAESAPEMESFERSRCGFQRLGSNHAMDEAIVEEDEDSNQDTKREENNILGLGVNVVEAENTSAVPIRRPTGRSGKGDGRHVPRRTPTPPDPFPLSNPIEIVDAEDEPRFSVVTKSSDESSVTPTVSPDPFAQCPVSSPLDSALHTPSLTYGTTPETASALSSADYRKTSFDIRDHRIHTARSSMTDRVTLNSSKAGDLSAGSVDDVPSLISSSSTMMSSLPNRLSELCQETPPTERSASLSSAVAYRSRSETSSKRASLASLSKLMGGPYSKSRLNITETLPPDSPEKLEKKRHRISRMMKFWKSKEKLSPG